MTQQDFLDTHGSAPEHLFNRITKAKEVLEPIQPQYSIVYEDSTNLDAPVTVTTPSPEWLAMALSGDYLPPIESYLRDKAVEKAWIVANPDKDFNWKDAGGATHPYTAAIPAMTEEEAMEYLLQKDVPPHVWMDDTGNRPRYKITKRSMVSADRTYRNAWRLSA
tara:strand:- start:325 stop:816 length:492 start_codon:yes stop_codon:yes gene_type:complete